MVVAGDRFPGNPYVDHALERGEPMIRLMNKVGYDVVTMEIMISIMDKKY